MNIPQEPRQFVWPAKLSIELGVDSLDRPKTLLRNRHEGPLRIQKALYPEGPGVCHAIIVHPPGGIAGGDQLEISLSVLDRAAAVLTTPGAAKWYGSTGHQARQNISVDIDGDLEWLPQEAIVFNRAVGDSLIRVNLAPQSRMIGWDGIVFGRVASGERFTDGHFSQSICLYLNDQLEWEERLRVGGADPALNSITGLAGESALSTIWAVLREGDHWTEEEQNHIRSHCPEIAWTALSPRLLVGRQRGTSLVLQPIRHKAWMFLRPRVMGRQALPLRIWAT